MMRVQPRPEPNDFARLVRNPGRRFLRITPRPSTAQWQTHSYWRRILSDLHDAYSGICAYSCHWIPYDTGADTVEHFLPKRNYPDRAYEWSNYRLVCATLNGRKRDSENVIDPFVIENEWFVLDFPSLIVKLGPGVPDDLAQAARNTIDLLGLNDEGTCLKSRLKWVEWYCLDEIPFAHLQRCAPFIAFELERQGLVDGIKTVMVFEGRDE